MTKFKPTQQVMVQCWDSAEDKVIYFPGKVLKYCTAKDYKGKVTVVCNGAKLYIEESKIVDFEEYWDKKKREKNG